MMLLHIVGQGPAVLAAGAGQVAAIFFIFFHLHFLMSFGRRLNMTEILWFRLLLQQWLSDTAKNILA